MKSLPSRALARARADAEAAFWRARLRKEPKLLIYSDSRGLNLGGPAKTRVGTYSALLSRRYQTTSVLCPFSHTTLLDFIEFASANDLSHYDAVVLHCGIVDFSPRPISNIDKVKRGKAGNAVFDEFFRANDAYYSTPDEILYEGEPTVNLCSPDYVTDEIVPRLLAIPRLIWIASNPFVPGWEGNYTRGRPANIASYVARFDGLMADALPNVVDLRDWNAEQVRSWTIDNIHFSEAGFAAVAERISQAVTNLAQLPPRDRVATDQR